MRTAFLTLATALALSGTTALSETKPVEGKPVLSKATKLEGANPPAAGAEGNRVEMGLPGAPVGGKVVKGAETGMTTGMTGSDEDRRQAS